MLEAEELRRKLALREPQAIDRPAFRRAAVLVPMFWREGEPHVVFTKRSEKVPHHKGQISFPGGAVDPGDADFWAAALRETEEEIGLSRSLIEPLGRLDDIITVTHFVVSPFVARVPEAFEPKLSDFEIDEIFDVSLRDLADPARMREESVQFEGRTYPIYYFEHKGHIIWGATGKILRQMLAATGLIEGEVPSDISLVASDF